MASDRVTPRRGIQLVWEGGSTGAPRTASPSFALRERHGDTETGLDTIYRGDCLDVLEQLLDTLAGRVDLIYIDPPFATAREFSAPARVAGKTGKALRRAYDDAWDGGLGGWLTMMSERLPLMRHLLSPEGSLYVHVDTRTSAPLRLLLDEIFGPRSFVNEVVWFYKTGGASEKLGFGRKHDTILFYARDPKRTIWNPQKEKSYLMHRYGFSNIDIQRDERGDFTWVNCRDVFDIPALRGNQPERVDYPTQKPEALLERIVRASSNPDSIVADLFCGSGTTLAVARRLGRRVIGCDSGAHALQVVRKRLAGGGPARAFGIALPGARPWASGAHDPSPSFDIDRDASGRYRVRLTGLRYQTPLPEALQAAVSAWSDAIDYWAVGEVVEPSSGADQTFVVRWCSFRTRQSGGLELSSDWQSPAAAPMAHIVDVAGSEVFVRLPV